MTAEERLTAEEEEILRGIETLGAGPNVVSVGYGSSVSMSPPDRKRLAVQLLRERAGVAAKVGKVPGFDIVPGWAAMSWSGAFREEGDEWRGSSVANLLWNIAATNNAFSSGYRFAIAERVLGIEKSGTDSVQCADVAGERGAVEDLAHALESAVGALHFKFLLIRAWVGASRDGAPADNPHAVGQLIPLAEAKHHQTRGLMAYLAEDGPQEEEGMLILDARFASHLETVGVQGKALAERWRKQARERWEATGGTGNELLADWTISADEPPRVVRMLALAIWRDDVGPRLLRGRKNPPATTRTVALDVLDLYSRRYEPRTQNGQQALVFPEQRGWVLVPSLFDGALSSILERGVSLLSSEIGIDLLEWQVTEAHRQFVAQDSDFRHISIEGGWSALAHEKLGLTSKRAPEMVRSIVLAQAHLRFESTGIRGNLLSYAEPRKHAPGQRSLVTLTLGDMLLAGFTHTLRETLGATSVSAREARRLVPVLGKAALIGKNNDHAAQRRMVWRFAIALRDRAEELAQHGHVTLPVESWARLATEAGAPHTGDFLARVQTAWEHGDEKASVPPLMVRVKGERDRYTLHESRKAALEFIIEGGKLTRRKRAEGTASARARAAGRRKGAKTS